MNRFAIAILISIFLLSCSSKDDVSAIRELIEKGAKLAEEHKIKELLELTTEDYVALPGNINRQRTKGILWVTFQHYGELKVMYPQPAVDITKTGANCFVNFMIVKKERTYPKLKELYNDPERWLREVGENADLYRLKLELVKKNKDWLVKKAYLEGFNGTGFDE